jgi:hypothetical protein
MAVKKEIRIRGERVGYIREESLWIYLLDIGGHAIGMYNKREDITYDENHRRVGNGNLLMTLLG